MPLFRSLLPSSHALRTLVLLAFSLLPINASALTGSEWRTQYFGLSDNTGPGADLADPDGDRISNVLEYFLNQNPSKQNANWGSAASDANVVSLTYTRRKAALAEVNVRCVWALDLSSGVWTSTGVTETILSDDGTLQTCKATVAAGNGRKFLKLEVTRVDAPTGVAVEVVSSSELRLIWAPGSGPVTGFKFERRISGTSTFGAPVSAGAAARAFLDSNLAASTAYVYEIWAEHNGARSTRVQARGTTSASTTTLPTAPSNVAVTALSTSSLKVQWADNSSNETGFRIERRLSGTTTFVPVTDVDADIVSYDDTGLSAGAKYYYRIAALNGAALSAFSDPALTGSSNFTIPDAPGSFRVVSTTNTEINLAWTDSFNSETGYTIEQRKSGTTAWLLVGQPNANSTTFTNSNLTAATLYHYRISVTNSGGTSAPSAVSGTTTSATTTPQRPTLWASPPWPINLAANAGYYVPDGRIAYVNNGPVIARFYNTGSGTILWAESFEGRGLDPGPYTAARGFGEGQGSGFKPGSWVNAGGGNTIDDMWFYADGDPRTGWRPSHVVFQHFQNDELVKNLQGQVVLINGGPIFARINNGVLWAESYEGQGYSATGNYPRGSGSFKPGAWLQAGGMEWRTSSQFSANDPR